MQIYDGNTDGLENFVDSSNLLKELCPKNPQMLVKFLKTRLIGKARLGLPPNIDDFDSLINDIRSRCQEKLNPDKIISQLKSIRQTDTKALCDEVELLSTKLKNVYLQLHIPEKVANDMSLKHGINALIEKVHNQETKIVLKAGQFASVSDASEKVLENERNSNGSQILAFNRNYYDNRKFVRNKYPPNTYNRFQPNTNNRWFSNRSPLGNNQATSNRFQNQRYSNNSFRKQFPNTNTRRVYNTQAAEEEHFLGVPQALEEIIQPTNDGQH